MNAKRDRGNRQLEVFRLIGEGKTMKEIGDELHLSPKTVEVHRSHIREKLRISSAAELISYAARTADDLTKRASRTGLFSKLWFDFSVPLSDERRVETSVPRTEGKC